MKSNQLKSRLALYRFAIFAALACALLSAPLLPNARTRATSSITVVNNLSLEVRHLYLSPANEEDWSGDQLNDSVIASGQSYTLDAVSCPGSQIRVIAEDQNGCFVSSVVSCSAAVTWTIPANSVPDCGQ
ncbi:MAG: hypothetical protein WCD76_12635 [Pyrinomonadaceae bacterium]